MKTAKLILLAFFPILAGWIYTLAENLPRAGRFFYLVLPALYLALWLLTGAYFARRRIWAPIAALGAHLPSLILLVVYLGQLFWHPASAGAILLGKISQYPCAPVALFTVRLGMLMPGGTSSLLSEAVTQTAGTLLLLLVFLAGYFLESMGLERGKKSARSRRLRQESWRL